jgi:hypothetical protein
MSRSFLWELEKLRREFGKNSEELKVAARELGRKRRGPRDITTITASLRYKTALRHGRLPGTKAVAVPLPPKPEYIAKTENRPLFLSIGIR